MSDEDVMTSEEHGQPRSEAFAREERAAFDAWVVPGAPPGLVDRVLATRRSPKRWPYALAAMLLLSLGLGWWLLRGEPVRGVAKAEVRMEQALADRGVAVLERGAALSWDIDRTGDALVEQSAGAVFYRVEPGGAFVVKVPDGEVRVRGTCFEVEVNDMGKIATMLGSGVVGAAVAAVVTVTVYEGRVEVARGADVRIVEPGQEARLAEGITIAKREPRTVTAADAVPSDPKADVTQTPSSATSPSKPATANAPDVVALREENKALKARMGLLEAKAKELDLMREGTRAYGLSQQQLDRMAEECELRWDTVPLRASGAPELRPEDLDLLDVSPDEAAAIAAAIGTEHDHVVRTLREAYVELTGDDMANVMAVAPTALLSEIMDKTSRPEVQRLFGLLSRERADHAPDVPPDRLALLGPTERVLRVLTASGDRFEAALAKVIGPERARAARDVHGGFGHVARSSNGCAE